MTEHDQKIIEAASRLAACVGTTPWQKTLIIVEEIAEIVAAKRESERPKLLSSNDGAGIYNAHKGKIAESIGAVLDACLDRAMKVIEALPRYSDASPRTPGSIVPSYDPAGAYVAVEHIRVALRPGASS